VGSERYEKVNDMSRFLRGSLRQEKRAKGKVWVLRFLVDRAADAKRVEHKAVVGPAHDFPTKASAWAEVERQHLHEQINKPGSRGPVTFGELAMHFKQHELTENEHARLARTTQYTYRIILQNYLLDRWGKVPVRDVKPLTVEGWLKALKETGLQNPTCDKIRRVMSLVFRHAQRHELIPKTQESNPMPLVRCKTTSDYEPIVLKPEQAFALLTKLPEPERTLTLLAAGTGLRISECLGLQWRDIDFENEKINLRRTWVGGRVGEPKSKASKCPVPMHRLLAEFMADWRRESPYNQDGDWVFPSSKLKGKKPRVGNMLVQDYIHPAAETIGILGKDDPRRFGFHNLRHSLASFLVRAQTDPKPSRNCCATRTSRPHCNSTHTAIWLTGGRPRAKRLRQF
jgi:integrase